MMHFSLQNEPLNHIPQEANSHYTSLSVLDPEKC